MPEKLRCAVIGTGGIGLDHLISLTTCPRATTVAIAESHPQRGKEASERFRIPRHYLDYRELLEQPDIDAVVIAAPNHLHAPMAIDALKARKHVLLEKPMATNTRDAVRILDAANKTKRTLMVAQKLRFDRYAQTAKLVIQRGDLGEIYHARCFWLRRNGIPRIGSWFTQKQFAGGGCTVDLGVHLLDLCLHLMGDFDVHSVFSQTYASFGPRGLGEYNWGKSEVDPKKPFDVEDSSVSLLRLSRGRTIGLEVSWAGHHSRDGRERGIDLLGTQAALSLYPACLQRPGAQGHEHVFLDQLKAPYSEDCVHHFVGCVLDNRRPLVAGEESVKVQRILDAIYASAAGGKEIHLNPGRS